jgi:IPT/TIG domain
MSRIAITKAIPSFIVLFGALSAFGAGPTITSLSTTLTYAGYAVTITGTNFGSTQGSSTVAFNGTPATPTSWGSKGTSIGVKVPAAATSGNVVVTVGGVASNGVALTVVPTLNVPSPSSGPVTTPAVNTSVTITGTGFGSAEPPNSSITFNGTAVSAPTSWSAASIVVPVPLGATSGSVIVTINGVASNARTFTVTPGITSLSLTQGPVQMGVVITGTTFGSSQGTSKVTLNGTKMIVVSWSAPSCATGYSCITVQVPTGATTGGVVVTVSNKPSNSSNFTVSTAFGCT